MAETKPLSRQVGVTVVIPAFDNAGTLRRALASVSAQTYRPIELIVADDSIYTCPLDECEDLLNTIRSAGIHVTVFSNPTNLGAYRNMRSLWRLTSRKYLAWMPHDDYWTDPTFLAQSISVLDRHDLAFAIAQSKLELSDDTVDHRKQKSSLEWQIQSGTSFITQSLFREHHSAYSAIVLNADRLDQQNYSACWWDDHALNRLHREPDEAFSSLILAGWGARVAVSSTVVSIRGNLLESWSKSTYWQRFGNDGVTAQLASVWKIAKESGSHDQARFIQNLMLHYYPPRSLRLCWRRVMPIDFILRCLLSTAWVKLQFLRLRSLSRRSKSFIDQKLA
jgi:glycosyltransferase involved in cell wall biosynthesis